MSRDSTGIRFVLLFLRDFPFTRRATATSLLASFSLAYLESSARLY